MTGEPSITFKRLMNLVESLGFDRVRQRGSHVRYAHPDGRKLTIPDHGSRDVPRGLLIRIVRYDVKMDLDAFWKIVKR